jgi:adenosylcobinamide-GDP ribazoletransferase
MGFFLALQFLTRIPVPLKGEVSPRMWGRSMAWFPLVGLLLGGLLWGGRWLLLQWVSPPLAAGLTVALWVLLSGGLHLDGFIDCCDALWAALPAPRRLEVLKDVHVGAYGLLGAILLLGLKGLALAELGVGWPLLLAPMLGRWAMVYVTVAFPYARPTGLGKMFKDAVGPREVIIGAVKALVVVLVVGWWRGLLLAALSWLVAGLLGWWAARKLGGGITGDVYGMVCEMVELAVLLAAAAIHA